VAPLTPNAWLRYDVITHILPAGVTDVLEIGCGQGSLGARLAQRYRYLGVEPDRASWTVAQRRVSAVGPGGEVRNVPVDALSTERFDLVCAFEVLEHIEDDATTLKEWAVRLRAGGWLLLSVPAHQRRYGPADELAGHFRRYDPEALTALLAQLRLHGHHLLSHQRARTPDSTRVSRCDPAGGRSSGGFAPLDPSRQRASAPNDPQELRDQL